ncbi:MAG: ATP-binding cassette domain-containing protein, partial [Acidobacteriota bacterium]|nr:ATP-binding cassette domain-containing protein [Acidobacteriota bacterium]
MSLIIAKNLSKIYYSGEIEVPALKSLSFEIKPGSFISFIGPSGSGKTTLLNLIGCLDKPTSGSLKVANVSTPDLTRREAAAFRGENLGFIFQDFNLIPVLTVFENVEYPLLIVQNVPARERRER